MRLPVFLGSVTVTAHYPAYLGLEAEPVNGSGVPSGIVAGSVRIRAVGATGVMVKDRQRYKLTGGWGFEAFKGDSRTERTVTDATVQCFGCHQPQKANDFVFSGFRP